MSTGCLWVYVTAPSREVASSLAELAVGERLAACANIGPEVTSVYRWAGAVQRAQEVVLVLKTTRARVERLLAVLAEQHPYDCPGIECLPVEAGHPPFLEWVRGETTPGLHAGAPAAMEEHDDE